LEGVKLRKTYIITFLLMAALSAITCSRKPDETLPARIGTIIVRFTVDDQFGLPASIPVTISFYTADDNAVLLRSEQVFTPKDSVNAIRFEQMQEGTIYLQLQVNDPRLTHSSCPDIPEFVKLNLETETEIITIQVRSNLTTCAGQ
jgi:hypothetical protein